MLNSSIGTLMHELLNQAMLLERARQVRDLERHRHLHSSGRPTKPPTHRPGQRRWRRGRR